MKNNHNTNFLSIIVKLAFCLLLTLVLISPTVYSQNNKSLKQLCQEQRIPSRNLTIKIYKKEHVLEVHYKNEILTSYPCVLGFDPNGDKEKEGDGKTPEGNFNVKQLYPHHSWSYFIWIDYPNATSWERFKKRKSEGKIPKSAKIGGEVGIHGVPEGLDDLIDSQTDWTLGCISLKTKDITDLYLGISKETKIEIYHSK